MNYLAHILLSGTNKNVQIGNFIGDAVKGKDYLKYPNFIQVGLLLHREIDSFTDTYAIVKKSKKRLHPRYGHYAGVIIDILYDHFLCINWSSYSNENLDDFIKNFYVLMLKYRDPLPGEIKRILPKLIKNDWFSNYKTKKGIARVLKGMQNYIKHDVPLAKGIRDLEDNFNLLNNDFNEFFPELQEHAQIFLKTAINQYEKK